MKEMKFKNGQVLIKQGDIGSEYFILKSGKCQVIVNINEGPTNKVKELEEGEGFGEVALLYDDKRTATIVAKTDGAVWMLDGKIYKQIIIQSTKERRSIEL